MKRAKKDRLEVAASRRSCPGLAPRTSLKLLYQILGENASPNPDGEGGIFPVAGWEFALTVLGTAWLTGQLFRLIDWIEGS